MEPVRLQAFLEKIRGNMVLGSCVDAASILAGRHGEMYWELGEAILRLGEKLGWNSADALTEYMVDYLKEQAYFTRNGKYGDRNFEQIKTDVYDNGDLMASYLPGLFLAYAFSPLMCEKYFFFRKKMLPNISGRVVEIGFGEGFYLWSMLVRDAGTAGDISDVAGYDISPYAVDFSERVFCAERAPLSPRLALGDVQSGLPLLSGSADCVILAEVIEHLSDPSVAVKEARRILSPRGLLYVASVIDSNHIDHITNFESGEAVDGMLRGDGFIVEDALFYRLQSDFPKSSDKSVGIAYVCRKR